MEPMRAANVIGLTRVLSGRGVLARPFHALFKRLVEGLDRVHLLR